MSYPLSADFRLDFASLSIVADGLNRPECVLAMADGVLVAAHGAGGYSVIRPGQKVRHVLAAGGNPRRYVPNGIALAPDGSILFANLGAELGGVFRIDGAGEVTPVIEEVEGAPIPPTNFVVVDEEEVLWFTVSTRTRPRDKAWNHAVADGFIGVRDASGTRILADGIGYTNEIAFSPDRRWVYVNETYNQRVSRFPLLPGPTLGPKQVVRQLDGADFPDGICFDASGGVWITCVGSNRLLLLRPDCGLQPVLEDTDTEHAAMLAAKMLQGSLSGKDMATAGRSRLNNVSSLAFGGPGLCTGYLGTLLGTAVLAFDSPIDGTPPPHWNRRLKG
jgi:sugar lactone lactonase YvrE